MCGEDSVMPCGCAQRASIAHEGYMCHVYVRADGLGATAVVNEDYPDRVAFTLLNTILDEFVSVHGDKWQGQTVDDCLPLCALTACLCCTTNGGVAAAVASAAASADITLLPCGLRPSLEATLTKYQDPAEADKLMAIQKDLDETKAIMHDTIEAALERCARPTASHPALEG